MDAKEIYRVLKSIVEPIHTHDDQMVAIAKWIKAEFEYKPYESASQKEAQERYDKAIDHFDSEYTDDYDLVRPEILKIASIAAGLKPLKLSPRGNVYLDQDASHGGEGSVDVKPTKD